VYSVIFRIVAGRTITVGARVAEPMNAGDCCCALEAAAANRSGARHKKNAIIMKARAVRTTPTACILSSRPILQDCPAETLIEDWTTRSEQGQARNPDTLSIMSDLGKVARFRSFAVDFGTQVIGAEHECSRAQIPDAASLLKRAGSASFGSGLADAAR